MLSSPVFWLFMALLLFWVVGAYQRLLRLRSSVVKLFGALDAQWVHLIALLSELGAAQQAGSTAMWASASAGQGVQDEPAEARVLAIEAGAEVMGAANPSPPEISALAVDDMALAREALQVATTHFGAALAVARARPMQPEGAQALSIQRRALDAAWQQWIGLALARSQAEVEASEAAAAADRAPRFASDEDVITDVDAKTVPKSKRRAEAASAAAISVELAVSDVSTAPAKQTFPESDVAGLAENAIDMVAVPLPPSEIKDVFPSESTAPRTEAALWQLRWHQHAAQDEKALSHFNGAVDLYNQAIAQFPARVLAWVLGFRPARRL